MHCCFIKPWYCYMHAWPWSFHSYSEAFLFLIISNLTLNYLIGDPQIVVWRYLHIPDGPDVLTTKTALVWVVLVQYIPRLLRIFPVTTDLKRTAGVFIGTAWAGAAYYLLWFMLAGRVSYALLCYVLSSIISIFCSSEHVMVMKFISGYIISEILPQIFLIFWITDYILNFGKKLCYILQ